MNRSSRMPPHAAGSRRNEVEEIEREFLGISLDLARLREKVLALAARLAAAASPPCTS